MRTGWQKQPGNALGFSGGPFEDRGDCRAVDSRKYFARAILTAGALALLLSACTSQPPQRTVASVAPTGKPDVTAEQLVGKWGLASYHQEKDRERTIKQAAAQCSNPYVIKAGPNGGVMMHLADDSKPKELKIKVNAQGRTFVGPEGPASIGEDREIASPKPGLVLARFVNREISNRYGTMVYVRCGQRA